MLTYVLSKEAETDLREIAKYTLNQWGRSAFQKYKSGLVKKMDGIGQRLVVEHGFSKNNPQLMVAKYRFHYIFYLNKNVTKPIIVAVIHEKRHIVNRLKNRLG